MAALVSMVSSGELGQKEMPSSGTTGDHGSILPFTNRVFGVSFFDPWPSRKTKPDGWKETYSRMENSSVTKTIAFNRF